MSGRGVSSISQSSGDPSPLGYGSQHASAYLEGLLKQIVVLAHRVPDSIGMGWE